MSLVDNTNNLEEEIENLKKQKDEKLKRKDEKLKRIKDLDLFLSGGIPIGLPLTLDDIKSWSEEKQKLEKEIGKIDEEIKEIEKEIEKKEKLKSQLSKPKKQNENINQELLLLKEDINRAFQKYEKTVNENKNQYKSQYLESTHKIISMHIELNWLIAAIFIIVAIILLSILSMPFAAIASLLFAFYILLPSEEMIRSERKLFIKILKKAKELYMNDREEEAIKLFISLPKEFYKDLIEKILPQILFIWKEEKDRNKRLGK